MEILSINLNDKKLLCILFLSFVCFIELLILSYSFQDTLEVDISKTNCSYSKHIGRRIFFHICKKDNSEVYDIRYFWGEESEYLTPKIIGVQLTKTEFQQICLKC